MSKDSAAEPGAAADQRNVGEEPPPLIGIILLVLPILLAITLVGVWPSTPSVDSAAIDDAKVQVSVLEERRQAALDAFQAASNDKAKEKAYNEAHKAYAEKISELQELENPVAGSTIQWFGKWGPESRLIIIVLIAGAIGSSIQAAKSFAKYAGTKAYKHSWNWWYFLRFPVGMGLALLVYLVIRGGLFAGSFADGQTATQVANPFGFAGLAALSGMFARRASDKLEEIFAGIFRTVSEPAAPVINTVPELKVGLSGKALKVKISGANFDGQAKAFVDGQERKMDWTGTAEASVTFLPEDVDRAKSLKLKIANPADKGGDSKEVEIKVVK